VNVAAQNHACHAERTKKSKFVELLAKFFIFLLDFSYLKSPHLLVCACKFMESLVERIRLDLREHLYTPHVLMGRKPPFKILGSSNTIVAQKKLIFILVRVIISPEKNRRKPVSILREGVKDFKLLNHIKLLVTFLRH